MFTNITDNDIFFYRDHFPGDLLLPAVMRFLTDPTQTPNSRVKVSTLTFLTHVAESSEPSALHVSCKSALARLLDWTNDVKSQDVRRHAQEAVVALYNLNPPQFPMILGELPKFYQVRDYLFKFFFFRFSLLSESGLVI